MNRTIFTCLITTMLLSACVTTPLPELESSDVPQQWQATLDPDNRNWPSQDWWTGFSNDELNSFIGIVIANNFDLEVNSRNLESAQISLRDAGFDLFPTPLLQVGTQPVYNDSRIDGDTQRGSANEDLTLGVSASYSNILSKPAVYDGETADYDSRFAQAADISLNTLSTAASVYFQLLLTRDRIEFSRLNVANAETIYAIATARVESGVAVPIEALQQQISLERERILLRNYMQDDLALRASLALLSGQSLQGFDLDGTTLDAVAIPDIQPGLTSELLTRRPDLVQAEAELRSSRANVDVVRSNYLPQISLTGSGNTVSNSLSTLVQNPDSLISLQTNLAQILLDNGQRGRNTDRAMLEMENSLSRYRAAVINAFNEIEVILSDVEFLAAQTEVETQNLAAAEESFRIAELRYEEGVVDFEAVLIPQNALFSTRSSYLNSKLSQLNAALALYQALGGGWEMTQAPAS